eukprot:13761424-Alexandrium_andersonii.AAC.1
MGRITQIWNAAISATSMWIAVLRLYGAISVRAMLEYSRLPFYCRFRHSCLGACDEEVAWTLG